MIEKDKNQIKLIDRLKIKKLNTQNTINDNNNNGKETDKKNIQKEKEKENNLNINKIYLNKNNEKSLTFKKEKENNFQINNINKSNKIIKSKNIINTQNSEIEGKMNVNEYLELINEGKKESMKKKNSPDSKHSSISSLTRSIYSDKSKENKLFSNQINSFQENNNINNKLRNYKGYSFCKKFDKLKLKLSNISQRTSNLLNYGFMCLDNNILNKFTELICLEINKIDSKFKLSEFSVNNYIDINYFNYSQFFKLIYNVLIDLYNKGKLKKAIVIINFCFKLNILNQKKINCQKQNILKNMDNLTNDLYNRNKQNSNEKTSSTQNADLNSKINPDAMTNILQDFIFEVNNGMINPDFNKTKYYSTQNRKPNYKNNNDVSKVSIEGKKAATEERTTIPEKFRKLCTKKHLNKSKSKTINNNNKSINNNFINTKMNQNIDINISNIISSPNNNKEELPFNIHIIFSNPDIDGIENDVEKDNKNNNFIYNQMIIKANLNSFLACFYFSQFKKLELKEDKKQIHYTFTYKKSKYHKQKGINNICVIKQVTNYKGGSAKNFNRPMFFQTKIFEKYFLKSKEYITNAMKLITSAKEKENRQKSMSFKEKLDLDFDNLVITQNWIKITNDKKTFLTLFEKEILRLLLVLYIFKARGLQNTLNNFYSKAIFIAEYLISYCKYLIKCYDNSILSMKSPSVQTNKMSRAFTLNPEADKNNSKIKIKEGRSITNRKLTDFNQPRLLNEEINKINIRKEILSEEPIHSYIINQNYINTDFEYAHQDRYPEKNKLKPNDKPTAYSSSTNKSLEEIFIKDINEFKKKIKYYIELGYEFCSSLIIPYNEIYLNFEKNQSNFSNSNINNYNQNNSSVNTNELLFANLKKSDSKTKKFVINKEAITNKTEKDNIIEAFNIEPNNLTLTNTNNFLSVNNKEFHVDEKRLSKDNVIHSFLSNSLVINILSSMNNSKAENVIEETHKLDYFDGNYYQLNELQEKFKVILLEFNKHINEEVMIKSFDGEKEEIYDENSSHNKLNDHHIKNNILKARKTNNTYPCIGKYFLHFMELMENSKGFKLFKFINKVIKKTFFIGFKLKYNNNKNLLLFKIKTIDTTSAERTPEIEKSWCLLKHQKNLKQQLLLNDNNSLILNKAEKAFSNNNFNANFINNKNSNTINTNLHSKSNLSSMIKSDGKTSNNTYNTNTLTIDKSKGTSSKQNSSHSKGDFIYDNIKENKRLQSRIIQLKKGNKFLYLLYYLLRLSYHIIINSLILENMIILKHYSNILLKIIRSFGLLELSYLLTNQKITQLNINEHNNIIVNPLKKSNNKLLIIPKKINNNTTLFQNNITNLNSIPFSNFNSTFNLNNYESKHYLRQFLDIDLNLSYLVLINYKISNFNEEEGYKITFCLEIIGISNFINNKGNNKIEYLNFEINSLSTHLTNKQLVHMLLKNKYNFSIEHNKIKKTISQCIVSLSTPNYWSLTNITSLHEFLCKVYIYHLNLNFKKKNLEFNHFGAGILGDYTVIFFGWEFSIDIFVDGNNKMIASLNIYHKEDDSKIFIKVDLLFDKISFESTFINLSNDYLHLISKGLCKLNIEPSGYRMTDEGINNLNSLLPKFENILLNIFFNRFEESKNFSNDSFHFDDNKIFSEKIKKRKNIQEIFEFFNNNYYLKLNIYNNWKKIDYWHSKYNNIKRDEINNTVFNIFYYSMHPIKINNSTEVFINKDYRIINQSILNFIGCNLNSIFDKLNKKDKQMILFSILNAYRMKEVLSGSNFYFLNNFIFSLKFERFNNGKL